MRIDGEAALVTGGASGLGAGTAAALLAAGARVALLDVDLERAQETAQRAGGLAVRCDVTDEDSVLGAIAEAERCNGAARILVNCAGIGPHMKLLRRAGPHPLDIFVKVLSVNLIGTFNCCRLAANRMAELEPLAEGERGVIVNTASVSAFDSPAGGCAYAASKAGVVGMTLPMARDLSAHGIRVVTISPGPFETPLYRTMPDEMTEKLVDHSLFPHRAGRPEEFGAMVRHIVENAMLNAENIRLDAGNRPPRSYC